MSLQLINHSPDLKKLRDDGYEMEINGGYLLIHHIPYLNADRIIKYGSLVSAIELAGPTTTTRPKDHTVYFIGDKPCNIDGSVIVEIFNSTVDQQLIEGVKVNHYFSNKPLQGYNDYFHKFTSYIELISAPAKAIDRNVSAKTYKLIATEEESVFQYSDTNSSRASIHENNRKFYGQKIAIIGLGGTGSYILDLVSKTPVQEIHLFDKDIFLQHNAFRSPGAISGEILDSGKRIKKVDFYTETYSKMHKGIIPHDEYVDEDNIHLLRQMAFVFVCIDNDDARKEIIAELLEMEVPFIDVGLGILAVDDKLIGMIRVTTGTSLKNDHLENTIPLGGNGENDYSSNIQIADLNSFNAVLAVMKWKKLCGFYQDLKGEHHSTYTINTGQLINEEFTA